VVAVVRGDKLVVANAGDSRAVLCRRGEAIDLSRDHKPTDEDERARIMKAGGFVSEGRVNGSLALSRAIGDLEYKRSKTLPARDQIVTAYPELTEQTIADGDEFIVIACDGIWDVLSSQQCVDYVRERVDADQPLSKICEDLADECMAPDTKGSGIGCDNMSVVIVLLKDTAFVPGADGKPVLRERAKM
jgi:serine/threonine protein phosphatase PrpC